MISIDPRDPRPLYEQVTEGFRKLIFAGVLVAGDKLPSVRSLATQLAINPNTIQRAYRELESQGLVWSMAGKGSFVADACDTADAHKQELLGEFDRITGELTSLGITPDELAERMRGGTSNDSSHRG